MKDPELDDSPALREAVRRKWAGKLSLVTVS
jgi:hypothetical protein